MHRETSNYDNKWFIESRKLLCNFITQ